MRIFFPLPVLFAVVVTAAAGCRPPAWKTIDPGLEQRLPDGSLPRLCARLAVCDTRWSGCVLAERAPDPDEKGTPRFKIVSGEYEGRYARSLRFEPPGVVDFAYEWLLIDEQPEDGCEAERDPFAEHREDGSLYYPQFPWLKPTFSCRLDKGRCVQVPLDKSQTL
jgi:hypothetical protein